METEDSFPYRLSREAQKRAAEKGIPLWKIMNAALYGKREPVIVENSTSDQIRCVQHGVAVIVAEDTKVVITVYLDRVMTPLRPDQIERGVTIRRHK